MGSEPRRGGPACLRAAVAAVAALLALAAPSAALAAEPWWAPVGLRGQAVTLVVPSGTGILALTRSGPHCLAPPGGGGSARGVPVCSRMLGHPTLTPGTGEAPGWLLRDGRVYREQGGGVPVLDPGSPHLGASASLLAAPAQLPGVVVAVAADGTVWRRDEAGAWARSLLLLPQGLNGGPPPVTGLAAFETAGVSPAVYLGTDGYAVLISTDGGDDWVRAAPGLPSGVLAVATDAAGRAVYAGTRDGLWVHHLQMLPAPPVYRASGLLVRWLEIAAIAVVATVTGLAVLARAGR